MNLLLRLHDTESGRITIDGQDIAHVTQESLRAAIGMVTQDTSLLHRSIAANIRYGKPTASEAEVVAAARKAQAHEFIVGLRDWHGRTGYGAHVGERGVKLSGGQRQRIALARVILKDAPILVLDEATSALDSEVELAIQEQLLGFDAGQDRHRDRASAVDDRAHGPAGRARAGKVVEEGTHEELLRLDGHYEKLWRHQSGGFIANELDERDERAAAQRPAVGCRREPHAMNIVACDHEHHAAAILAILNDAIVHSTALFDYEPRPPQSMVEWFRAKEARRFPVLGAVADDGRCSASRPTVRSARGPHTSTRSSIRSTFTRSSAQRRRAGAHEAARCVGRAAGLSRHGRRHRRGECARASRCTSSSASCTLASFITPGSSSGVGSISLSTNCGCAHRLSPSTAEARAPCGARAVAHGIVLLPEFDHALSAPALLNAFTAK